MEPRLPSLRKPPIGFAHRGARAHAPENTIEAFTLALKLGATGLESDVWTTADGHAVLDHDGVVGHRLRRRPIATLRREELPDHIPTLAELYEACGSGFELSLDVKDPGAVAELVATARDVGPEAESRLWLCHDDIELMVTWRELSPRLHLVDSTRLRHLGRRPEEAIARISRFGLDAVNLHHSDWTGGLTTMVHRFGLLAFGWDAQFDRVLDSLLDIGIDGVYSDHVDTMTESLGRYG